MNESISDVEYEPRTELDYGTLLCLAENTVSRHHHHHQYHHDHVDHQEGDLQLASKRSFKLVSSFPMPMPPLIFYHSKSHIVRYCQCRHSYSANIFHSKSHIVTYCQRKKWSKIVKNGQNGQNGPKLSKMVPNGPKSSKMIKNGEK